MGELSGDERRAVDDMLLRLAHVDAVYRYSEKRFNAVAAAMGVIRGDYISNVIAARRHGVSGATVGLYVKSIQALPQGDGNGAGGGDSTARITEFLSAAESSNRVAPLQCAGEQADARPHGAGAEQETVTSGPRSAGTTHGPHAPAPMIGMPGDSRAGWCAAHKLAGMVDVKTRKCRHTGCAARPSFGMPGDSSASWCSEHKLASMEFLLSGVHKRALEQGTSTNASSAATRQRTLTSSTATLDVIRAARPQSPQLLPLVTASVVSAPPPNVTVVMAEWLT